MQSAAAQDSTAVSPVMSFFITSTGSAPPLVALSLTAPVDQNGTP
jgi:hypothetical protein